MTIATRIDEIVFEVIDESTCHRGSLAITIRYDEYEDLPKALEHKGNKFARVGYNSDNNTAYYTVYAYSRLAKNMP